MRRLALALSAFLLLGGQPGLGQQATPVRIGVINTDVSSEPVYAEAEGFLQRAGLSPTIATLHNGKEALDALAAGSLDIDFANTVSVIGALQKGAKIEILAPATIYDPAHPITEFVQAASSHYTSGRDLDGKNVGAPAAGGGGEVFTRAWIEQTGGDPRTLHYVVGIPSTQLADALAAHRIEAAELSEPTLTEEKRKGRIKRLAAALDVVGGPYYIGLFVARRAWVEAHPEAARAFTIVMRQTAHWANAHHAETAAILAKRLNVSPAITASMTRAHYGEVLDPALIQAVVDISVKYGALKPVRAAELLPQP